MKKSPKDCLLVPVWKFKYNVRLAVRLADSGRDLFLYRIPATRYAGGKILALMSCVCRERQAPDREEYEAMH